MPFFFLFLAAVAFAGVRTAHVVKTELKDSNFKASLLEGYHFNAKAPNSVTVDGQSIKPAKMTDREIEFTGLPVKFSQGQAALYICDDAVTFCETQLLSLKGGAAPQAVKAAKPARRGRINKHGFIEDDFQQAMETAKKKKQNVLIDFSARWCPGCIRLENEMFDTKAFKEMTGDLVKLKVDMDRFENGVLGEKYKVKGIPTLLVVNPNQEEIARIIDFQPAEVLQPFFAAVRSDPASLDELKAKAQDGDNATLLRLGKRLAVAGRPQEALEVLKKVKPAPPELLPVSIAAAGNENPKARESALRAALKAEPASIRSIGWRSELADLVSSASEKKKLRDEGVALADSLLSDPGKLAAAIQSEDVGEYTGFEPMMVALSRAELVEYSGATPAEVNEAWKKSARIGLALDVPAQKQSINIRLLSMLLMAKLYQDADRVSQKLLNADPGNPELQRRRLRVLVELKRYDEAIALGRKVVKNSYGRNEFWAAEILAKAYVESGRTKEAEKFINGYLGRNEIGWANMKESRKAFEELRDKVAKR